MRAVATRFCAIVGGALAAGLALATPSQASITYTFELIPELADPLFVFTQTVPDFITDETAFPFGNCLTLNPTVACTIEFHPDSDPLLPGAGDDYDVIRFVKTNAAGQASSLHLFAPGAFLKPGVYIAVGRDDSRLTVRDDSATTVPEPGAWALMILGFGGVGATLRNRRVATSS